MNHAQYCDALDDEVERFARAMSSIRGDTNVATCPGWTVDVTALHLGTIHRWARELVRTRSSVRIPRATPSLEEVEVSPEWIREGGRELVSTLREADPDDAMWAWGLDQHVRFWSRRQVHETLVHRIDIELAGANIPSADAELSSDAIDEFLFNLMKVTNVSSATSLCGNGERLAIHAADSNSSWTITLREGGFDIARSMSDHDVLVEGSSLDLLLVILRRRSSQDVPLGVTGDARLVDFWLSNSAFD